MKIPRKLKKAIKAKIVKAHDGVWKSKEIKITSIQKNSRYRFRNPTVKGVTLMGFTLGV